MKRLLFAAALTVAPYFATADSVSVSIGQPGFYGRLDMDADYPKPAVIYSQPVVIEQVPVERAPIYLRVPSEHAKNWQKHCRDYSACGERVFFVQDDWYTREYAPRYRERHIIIRRDN